MKKYWTEDFEKVRQMAKAERKLLVLEYDACIDADSVSAMTPEEFAEAKADYDKRSIYGGWICVRADYTTPLNNLKFELNELVAHHISHIDITISDMKFKIKILGASWDGSIVEIEGRDETGNYVPFSTESVDDLLTYFMYCYDSEDFGNAIITPVCDQVAMYEQRDKEIEARKKSA